jgi:hypothetical protein
MPLQVTVSSPIEWRSWHTDTVRRVHVRPPIPGGGINPLTSAAKLGLHTIDAPAALPVSQARHETRELQQVRNAKERATLPNDDFRIRVVGVGPLRRNRANRLIGDAQQKPLAGSVEPLAHTNELSPTQWVKRMGHTHKTRRTRGRICIPG